TTEVEAHPALLEREDCTLVARYRCLYAPRTGGAYDSHHRTAEIAGRTRRRGGRVAACGARAAGLPCLLGGCTGTDVWSNKTEVSRPSRSPSIRYGTSPALPNASARWKPTCLFEQTAGMFPELVTRPDMQVFLPPIGGTTVYLFGEVEKLDDPRTQVTCRVHDECNGSDVFGSEALKNTFPASDPVSVEQPT